jgi:hypothetical protein
VSLNYFFKRADENFSSMGGEIRIFLMRGRDVLVRGVGRNDFNFKKSFLQARLFLLLNGKLVAKKDSADRASVDSPPDSPPDSLVDFPADSSTNRPADSPADIPADSSANTPVDSPADSPAEKSMG